MEDQIILVDKPAGISSFGVVARVRAKLRDEFGHKVKVGHTGTLDPFATGLLILLSGKMTKKSGEFLKLDKEYEATMKLGYVSTTGDTEGEIQLYPTRGANKNESGFQEYLSLGSRRSRLFAFGNSRPKGRAPQGERANPRAAALRNPPNQDSLESTLQSFVGEIEQTVPKYSAVKINGQRAYKLARAGKDFETPTRKVTIYSIEVLDYKYPDLKIRCHVSSGTYIRTLAEDIGEKLGTGAYLTALRRTKIGDYDVKDAIINLC